MSDLDWLIYNLVRRILICTLCRFAITSDRAKRYRKDKHAALCNEDKWVALCAQLPLDEAISPNDADAILTAEAYGYSPYLNVWKNGYRCTFGDCGYCAYARSTIAKHL